MRRRCMFPLEVLVACCLAGTLASMLALGGCARCSVTTELAVPVTETVVATPRPVPLAGKVAPPGYGALLGVYIPPAPFDIDVVRRERVLLDKQPAILMWYQPWATANRSEFDRGAAVSAFRRGFIPMVTWEPWDPGKDANLVKNPGEQSAFKLSRIVDGSFDTYIRSWARDIKSVGGPVMLRPMHEMNGSWYPWCGTTNGNTPAEFRSAWRHIHDIFAEEGATNVTWVWSINHISVPATSTNAYAAYYPGDEYVDWTAISGFNWGDSTTGTDWQSYRSLYFRPLAYLETLGKPIVIAEFASVSRGGDKAAWLRDAYLRIATDPRIDAVVYYDAVEEGPSGRQDWPMSSSAESNRAYGESVARPYFLGGPAEPLKEWLRRLDMLDEQNLADFHRRY